MKHTLLLTILIIIVVYIVTAITLQQYNPITWDNYVKETTLKMIVIFSVLGGSIIYIHSKHNK